MCLLTEQILTLRLQRIFAKFKPELPEMNHPEAEGATLR
jgi:hypothetical protein